MAAPSVTFDGTRVNPADVATNWGHFGGSGPAPAAEAPLAYQNSIAINKKVTSATLAGIDYDPGAGAIDMTTATATHTLMWFKVYVSDSFDLDTTYGVSVGIGSALADHYLWNVAGSGHNGNTGRFAAYPAQGGYLIVAINPNVATWRESTAGTPALGTVDWFAAQCDLITGAAKAENLAIDALDAGIGLNLVGGDGVSTDAVFFDFITADQDTTTNRWGIVTEANGIITAQGRLVIGRNASGTVVHTDFTDPDQVVVFPDSYIDEGDFAVEFDISDVGSICSFGGTLISKGSLVSGNDTRADLLVVEDGTPGSLALSCTIQNFRDITLDSAVTVDGGVFSMLTLTPAGAEIKNSVLTTLSAANAASLTDPVFAAGADIHDTDFVQGGAGHAVQITGATQTITLTNCTWTGYGANDAADSAIEFTGTGPHTVNVSGGTTPTIQDNGSTVTVVNSVTVKVTLQDAATQGVIASARVLLHAAAGGPANFEAALTSITNVTTTATVTHTAVHGLATGDQVMIEGANEGEYNGVFTITVTSTTVYTYVMSDDPGGSATGTPVSTTVILNGVTDGSGIIQDTGYDFVSTQATTGRARKGTATPRYKTSVVGGTIISGTGMDVTAFLVSDD